MLERVVVLAALFAVACDGTTTTPAVPTVTVPTVSLTNEPAIVDPGVFASKRFGLRLRLPHSANWKIDDTRNPWLTATQPEASSTLLVRLWRDEPRMTRDKCEASARSFRALPARENAELLSQQRLDLPEGFDTQADVGLVSDGKGGLFGFILAFGGRGRKCFAYVYVTKAEGMGSDSIIADRLAEMTEASLVTLKFESDLEGILQRDIQPAP